MKSTQTTVLTKAILKQCEPVSQILKSLSHPVRLKILCSILDGEKTVNELTEFCEISQSAMSQFLNRMKLEGIVVSRRDRTFVYYGVADPKITQLLKALKEIYC